MSRVYHKGKYNSGERWKHLRPFLKQVGNRRWRKDAAKQIEDELDEDRLAVQVRKMYQKRKKIKMKITMESVRGLSHSYKSYDTLKKAEAVIARYSVIRTIIFERKGQILKSYEKHNTSKTRGNRKST